jgi:membrane-associated protease RseP (regulator of RpoE activity)
MAPLDPERSGGGDVASLAGPTPQPEQPEISPIERPILPGFSRLVDTPLPRKSADAVSRPPKQPAATKSGPGTVRQTLESGSLRETLNRLSNGVASPNTPGAAHTENNLQSPPQYPTFSTSAVGLFCQTVTSDTAHDLGLETPRGLWCTGVAAGSAAAIAGIRTNDILLTINGSEMRDLSGLGAIASASAPGRLIPVEILRHGNKKTVQLQIDQLRH